MKTIKSSLIILLAQISIITSVYATSYTWNGNTSTSWGTNTNWTPNGIPGAADNVTIVSTTRNPIYNGVASVTNFTMTSGILILNGYTLNVTGTGTFNGGTITGGKISVNNTGSVTVAGTVFNCKFISQSNSIYLNGSTFKDSTFITRKTTGSGVNNSIGGNKFYGYVSITNKSTGNIALNAASPFNPDTVWSTLVFNMDSTGTIYPAYSGTAVSTYYGNVYINKKSASSSSDFIIANSGKIEFHDTIWVSNTSTRHINFGNNSGCAVSLKSNATINVGASGFTGGNLYLKYLTKTSATAVNLNFSTVGSIVIGPSTTINGQFTYTGKSFQLSTSTFNNIISFTCNSSTTVSMTGGNIFNAEASFINSGTGNLIFANGTGDDFNANVNFTKGSTGPVYPAYQNKNYFGGNIICSGTVWFGSGGATAYMTTLDGTGAQQITAPSGQFKKLTLNNSGLGVTLNNDITITDSIKFIAGVFKTGSNKITLNDNCISSGASDASYVEGKVKKNGNDAFTFPVGKSGQFRSIAMTAPANTTDAYTAEYFWDNSNSTYSHSSKDATIAELSRAEYWKLDRNTGTSNVSVTLSWESNSSCSFSSTTNLRVAAWDGTKWKDKGNGGTTGNTTAGTIVTNGVSTTYGAYSLATTATFDCYCFDATDLGNNNVTLNNQNFTTLTKWYKFKSDSSWTDIKIVNLGISTTQNIQALEVFSSCDGSGVKYGNDSITSSADTILLYKKMFNQSATYYYIKLTRTTTGSGTADFNLTLRGGSPSFTIAYQSPAGGDCGIDYAQVTKRLNKRHNDQLGGPTNAAPDQVPVDYVFTGIPSNAILVRAFVWFTTVTTDNTTGMKYNVKHPDYTLGACPTSQIITDTRTLTNAANGYQGGAPTATCWNNVNACETGTRMYFDDLTSLFNANNITNLNGTYTIDNIFETTAGGDVVLDGTCFDASGGTLMLIYKVPCTHNTRPARFVVWNGISVISGGAGPGALSYTRSGLNAFASNTAEKAFMIVSDVETNQATFDINLTMPAGTNGILPFSITSPFDRMHTYHELTSASGLMPGFTANQNSLIFRYDHDGWCPNPPNPPDPLCNKDCNAIVVMGAYMQDASLEHECTPISVTAAAVDACTLNRDINLSSTVTGGASPISYLWTPNGATTQNTTGNGSNLTNFIVRATGADGCVAKDDVVGGSCYTQAADYYACNTTASAFLSTWPNFYNTSPQNLNNNILIDGVFTIDIDFTLNNRPNVHLAPNAKIIVNSGSGSTPITFTIDNSIFNPCMDYMWDGIYVDGPLSKVRVTNASEFHQAINAIHSNNGGYYDVDNSKFLDCHIGIYVQNYNPSSLAAHQGKVITSTFKQYNNLLPPYACEIYFAGMDIIRVSKLTIGATNTSTNNLFDNLRFGVRMQQADVTLYRNSFANIDGNTIFAIPLTEGAVVALGNNINPPNLTQQLKVIGTANVSTQRNNFTNCNYGVFAHLLPVDVSIYNNFDDVAVGVWLRNSRANTQVKQNYFTNSPSGTAIRVQNLQTTAYSEQINNNNITGHLVGIQMDNLKNARAWTNTIDISTTTGNRRGITLSATRSNQVDDNVITKTSAGDPGSGNVSNIVGILATNNNNPLIGDNTLTKMGSGITVIGSNPNSKLACNHHNTGYYGFRMLNAWTNNQVLLPVGTPPVWIERPTGNDWTGMVSSGTGGYDIAGNVIPIVTKWLWKSGYPTQYDPTPKQCYIVNTSTEADPCPFSPVQEPTDTTLRKIIFEELVLDTAKFAAYSEGIHYYNKEWFHRSCTPKWTSIGGTDVNLYKDYYNNLNAGNMKTFYLSEDTASKGYASAAISLNNSITPQNTIESYRKLANGIYFKSWLQDTLTFSPADSAALKDIIDLNALTNGPGIYTARILMGYTLEDNYDGSNKTDEEWFPTEEEQVSRFTKIYPNPNSGQMQMEYQLPESQNGIIQVLDFSGRELQELNLYEGMHTLPIDISNYGAGIYFARIFVNNQYLYSEKIVLIK